jgi:hypothetical protein
MTLAKETSLRCPYGTPAPILESAFPTLKRGANKLCAYGAAAGPFRVRRAIRLGSFALGLRLFDFDEGRIEGRSAANVGEPFAGKGIDVDASRLQLGPVESRGNDACGKSWVQRRR